VEENWFDRKHGPNPDLDELGDARRKPSIRERLQRAKERRESRPEYSRIKFSDRNLGNLLSRLDHRIFEFSKLDEFSPDKNQEIWEYMLALILGGGRLPEEFIERYETALGGHNIDTERGYLA